MPSQSFDFTVDEDLVSQCQAALMAGPKHEFSYPETCSATNWPIDEIKKTNAELLRSLRHRANVYAIFVKASVPGSA